MAAPKTQYTSTVDGVHIAYQVTGSGPWDLVFIPSAISHIETYWEEPTVGRYLNRLASFSRLLLFDKRGVGMSDRIEGVPTLEERMDDVRAVMDAASSERATIWGMSEGGAIAAMFAATYPERVQGLILFNAAIRCWVPQEIEPLIDEYLEQSWGSGGSLDTGAPSVATDTKIREWCGRVERLAASPATAAAMLKMNASYDARSVLPAVSVPTLVVHRDGDPLVGVDQGREAARLIPEAKYVELAGTDHLPFFEDPETTLGLIEEFVTGERRGPEHDRVLATVVFTDIVGSTERASQLGDRRWRELLDDYDSLVDVELERFRGRLVKTTGDGTLATFDGPARALRCVSSIVQASKSLGLTLRAGLHTGEIELRGDDVTGLAVVIAQRVSGLAQPDEILASSTIRDLVVGSGIEFEDRGEHPLKGVPGTWRLFAATD